MEIWDAGQRGDRGGKVKGVSVAFVNVYRSLFKAITAEIQFIENYYSIAGILELRI